MSHRALSPQQFFHGTTAELQPGDTVKPASEIGHTNYPDLYRQDPWRSKKVFMSSKESDAWDWGESVSYMQKKQHRVYEVEPSHAPLSGGISSEYIADQAKVKRRIDIPPLKGMESEGRVSARQGELPGHYWTGERTSEGREKQRTKETADAEQGVRDRRLQALHEGKIPFKGQGKLF